MKILFVNGSRGEWGYIRPIIDLCIERGIDYEICATNMLLLPGYGSLIDEIKADGYRVSDEIYMSLEGSNHFTMAKSLGIFLMSFVDTLKRLEPDWIMLAGDRGEQLVASIASAFTYIPTAHIQAGERSGNIDGVSRHAIGRFAHIHFSANEDAEQRLLRMGEEPFRVHHVGAPQLDEMVNEALPSRADLSKRYNVDTTRPYLLVVQHPVTEELHSASRQIDILTEELAAIDMPKVWVLPNNDAGSNVVRRGLAQARTADTFVFENLTRRDYLAFMAYCGCMVGNSSSGLLEAPTFKIAAVNLGRRQADRVQGPNVINAAILKGDISSAIRQALSDKFQASLTECVNPYGDGQSSGRILDVLEVTPINDRLLIKKIVY